MTNRQTQIGYDRAQAAIAAGEATGHALWILLSAETDRDGYALKPDPWEGPGEYQHVSFAPDRQAPALVRIPAGRKSLPTDWPKGA